MIYKVYKMKFLKKEFNSRIFKKKRRNK